MLLRRFTDFILQNRARAVSATLLLTFIPFIGAGLSILVALFVTLRKGAFEGTWVLAAAIVPYLLGYALSPSAAEQQAVGIAVAAVTIINVLSWFLALVLRRYANWSLVIEISVLSGILLVVMLHLIFPDIQHWWAAQLTAYLDKTATMLGQLSSDGAKISEEMQSNKIVSVMQYMTGFVAASLIINALFQLVIARWWQAIIFNPGGLRQELYQIRLGYVSAIAFVVIGVLASLGSLLSLDMLPVMMIGFCCAGLSVLHNIVRPVRTGWLWLVIVYFSIMFIYPYGIVSVALIGLLDSIWNIRQKFKI